MIKLITPLGMLFTSAMMVIFSVYAFLIGTIEDSWILLTGCVTAAIAGYGVAMLRPWSQHLVYVLAAGFIVKLGLSIYAGLVSGYFDMRFESINESLGSLAPSIVMATLSCICCYVVFRHFHRPKRSWKPGATRSCGDVPVSSDSA